MGEHLPCKQGVTSSNLVISTRYRKIPKCSLKTAYMKYNKTSNIQNNFFRYEMNQNNKSIRRYVYKLAGQANKSTGWMPWH